MILKEFKIEGMSCGHCVAAVKKELSKLTDIIVDDVQIGNAKVKYDENKVTQKNIVEAIEGAGYKVSK